MRFVVAPDSYKGSLSAIEVANIMEAGIKEVYHQAVVEKIPIADGGEGTVDAFLTAVGGKKIELEVKGPLGEKIPSYFGILPNGKTAVVEMAAASGLPLVPKGKENPLITTTYGTGELLKAALDEGVEEIIIGIGGSATNDGGIGMAQALGVKLYDKAGKEVGFGGGELKKIHRIDTHALDPRIQQTRIVVACDVDNPLYGPKGAAYVFAPQKGADPEMVKALDEGLRHYGERLNTELSMDIQAIPGAGAAGGLGAGLLAFLQAKLMPGIDIIIEYTNLEEKIKFADIVITGEGRTDFQTAHGKAPVGIAKLAKKYQKPVLCISGGLGEQYEAVYDQGIDACFSIVPGPVSLDEAMVQGEDYLKNQVRNICKMLRAF
jgi:glycerate kinase